MLSKFNDALLAKISWRILTKPSCLLARTLLGKYCKNTPFVDCHVPNSASHGWRGICLGRDLLKNQLGKAIGDGKTTKLWTDPWLSTSTPLAPVGPPCEQSQNLMVAYLLCTDSKTWNRDKIRQLIPAYEQQILEIQPSKLDAQDKIIWLPSKTGDYSAKSGYYEAIKETANQGEPRRPPSCNTNDFNWTSHIWNLKCPPKQKFTLWKAMKNALPVGANLLSRGITSAGRCPHCGQEETTVHLFFHCNFAVQVWSQAPFKSLFEPSRIESLRTGIESFNRQTTLPPSGIGEYPLAPWIFWAQWTSRNKKIFENKVFTPLEILTQAISQAREWISAQPPKVQTSTKPRNVRSRIINSDHPTVFTYAAWRIESKDAGFGWIIKNHHSGPDILRNASSRNVRSALMAEAMALLLALQHAKALGISSLSVASDSQQLIKAINKETPLTELHGILHDILILSSSFEFVNFMFVSRCDNREADELSKLGLSIFPSFVSGLTGLAT